MQKSFEEPSFNSHEESHAELEWFYGIYSGDDWIQNGPVSTRDVQKLAPKTAIWNGVTVKEWTLLKNVDFGPNSNAAAKNRTHAASEFLSKLNAAASKTLTNLEEINTNLDAMTDTLPPQWLPEQLPAYVEPSAPPPPTYAEATAPPPPSYDQAVGRASIDSFSNIENIQRLASEGRKSIAGDLEWYCGVYDTNGEWTQAGPLPTYEIQNLDPKTAVWNGVTVLEWTLIRDLNIPSNPTAPAPPAYDQAVGIAAVESNMSSLNMLDLLSHVSLADDRESIAGEHSWYCGVYDDAGDWTQAGPLTTFEVQNLDPMTAVWNGITVTEWTLLKNVDIKQFLP